jgi:hypothetical protein
VYFRVFVAVIVVVVSAMAGLWLGEHWDDVRALWATEPAAPTAAVPADAKPEEAAPEEKAPPFNAPLYFYAGAPSGGNADVVREETTLAAGAGVHRHIVNVPLPWPGQDAAPALERLDALFAADPDAKAVVSVNLNPPAAWLEAHPTATVTTSDGAQPFACAASEVWRNDAKAALTGLIQAVKGKYDASRILGYMVGALKDGRWHYNGGHDTSEDNAAGYRRWLRTRYADDAALKKAWADEETTFDTAAIPEMPKGAAEEIFLDVATLQNNVDFLQYTSEAVADAIAAFATHVKDQAGAESLVYAPYGYTLDIVDNAKGHLGLAKLLNAPVDVFVGPVSSFDRGVGGAGGYMGPVDTVLGHDKQWLLIDDTRTGVATESADAAATTAAPNEDVFNVQRRNFASAVCRGIALCWADPEGAGWLKDRDTWDRIARMREAYEGLYSQEKTETPVRLYEHTTLAVVVDETSRFYERSGGRIGEFLQQCQNAALRAGVPVQFCLLQDVLNDAAPPSPVYWFLNAFRLTTEQRARLHEILQRDKASVIWSYAPGYIADSASADNIAATVRMGVKALKKGGQSSSTYELVGKWATKDDVYGTARQWDPLFYIDDDKANILARYADSHKPSAALAYVDEGWRSVYLADPSISPAVLREILTLLDEHIYFRKTPPVTFDAAYFAPELVAVHAGDAGDRPVDFGQVFDVRDLFDPESGWPRARVVDLALYPGETRILGLDPPTAGN